MTRTQLRHRDRLFARHEAALSRWPDRSGSEFMREMRVVVQEIELLAREAHATRGDRLESARTWRYVANAYFDLGNGRDPAPLRFAVNAFQKAETLLQGIDNPIEKMKLDFSYGRVLLHLFHLSEGKEVSFAQEARLRHASALAIAEAEMPGAVESAKTALAEAEQVIALLQAAENLSGTISELEHEVTRRESLPTREGLEEVDDTALFGQLLDVYNKDVDAGKVSETRKQALDAVLSQFRDILRSKPSEASALTRQSSRLQELKTSLSHSISQSSRARELAASMMHLVGETGQGALSAGSRADAIWQRFSRLKLYLAKEIERPHMGNDESASGMELYKRCAYADTYLHEPGRDDTAVRQYEVDVLRQLASEVRGFSLRHHLMLASPVWPSSPLPQDPNAVFFSGGDRLRQALAKVCEKQRLKLLTQSAPKDFAAMRWDHIRACHVAVFDFARHIKPDYQRPIDLANTGPVAAVSYELGIALTLGRAVVVVAKDGQDLPFDVDIEPVQLKGDGWDDERLAGAIDDAMYGLQRGGEESSIASTWTSLQQRFSGHKNFIVAHSLKLIDDAVARDPVKFRRFVEPCLAVVARMHREIIYPAWPGSYPQAHVRRLFHVTAFGPRWAQESMKIAVQACDAGKPPAQYIRGDQVLEPDIIRSIWDNLCQASHVLVDLTGLNANVALELGITHTLGRMTLIVTQDSAVEKHFPAIGKTRMHRYLPSGEPGLNSLRDTLDQFLAEHD